jgi:hypothetical protein
MYYEAVNRNEGFLYYSRRFINTFVGRFDRSAGFPSREDRCVPVFPLCNGVRTRNAPAFGDTTGNGIGNGSYLRLLHEKSVTPAILARMVRGYLWRTQREEREARHERQTTGNRLPGPGLPEAGHGKGFL